MVRLFVSDIDGCIAEPYKPYDMGRLKDLVRLIRSDDEAVPAFGLCSGRAYSYVEAVSQMLGVNAPVIFESGGGMFNLETATVTWNPTFTPDVERQMLDIGHWLVKDCLPGTNMMFDFGKRTQVGIAGPDVDEVMRMVPRVEEFVQEHFPSFRVFHTPISIDVSFDQITKRQAMEWLSADLAIPLEEIAYIGDTNGDLPALEIIGHSFAPANATSSVRRMVDHVTDGSVTDGVYEAFNTCIDVNRNRKKVRSTGS